MTKRSGAFDRTQGDALVSPAGLAPRARKARTFGGGRHSRASDGDGEGTWIYSYADLITLLLMFFLVLLSLAQVSDERFRLVQENVEQALTGAVKTRKPIPASRNVAPGVAASVSGANAGKAAPTAPAPLASPAKPARGKVETDLKKILESLDSTLVQAIGGELVVEKEAIMVVVPVTRLFRPRSVLVDPAASAHFQNLVAGLAAVSPAGSRLSIEVHTAHSSGLFPWGTTATRAGALGELAFAVLPRGWSIRAAGLGANTDPEAGTVPQRRRVEIKVLVPQSLETPAEEESK